MKIVVSSGHTVHVAEKAGTVQANGTSVRPVVKAHGPKRVLEVSDADGELLLARGFATKYEPPKAEDPTKEKDKK